MPTFLSKLEQAPAASFHVLDPAKAARMNAATLYIPSPQDVAEVIRAIPRGQTRTIVELRHTLAQLGGADTACPAKTIKYWKWMAQAEAEIESSSAFAVPWWRVLKDGKLSKYGPGGLEHQAALLRAEGVQR